MKNSQKILSLLVAAVFMMTACVDDDQELGALLDKSEIQYEVTQDLVNDPGGNTIILKNNTPGTISMWDYGTGRSTRQIDTIHVAFKGEYVIKFSAVTAGGIVDAGSKTVTVTADNLDYVNDPLWAFLSGGVGKSKTWILDNGDYGLTEGPFSYADPSRSQVWGDFQINWDPGDVGQTADDMAASMTFSLIGGPFLTTVKPNETGASNSGTYFLDTNNHTLTTTDASVIRVANMIPKVGNWNSNLRILELTEDQLRIAVYRTNSEGPWWFVINYVSKEYADNYVPVDEGPDEGYNPTFEPGELLTMLTGESFLPGRVWQLDTANNPVDWIAAGKGWTETKADSKDWGWNNSWVTAVKDSWIRFDHLGGTQNYTRYQNGVVTTGTFSINEATNEVTLTGNTLLQNAASWMNPIANKIKVVKAFNKDFTTKGIWFGTSYDAAKDEWLSFHYIVR